jgi:hypothetical protein
MPAHKMDSGHYGQQQQQPDQRQPAPALQQGFAQEVRAKGAAARPSS